MVRDVVALEGGSRPVTRNFHDHRFSNPRSPQVSNGSPAQIMGQTPIGLASDADT
jgi:hypothetical protein